MLTNDKFQWTERAVEVVGKAAAGREDKFAWDEGDVIVVEEAVPPKQEPKQ
jgi:hypothetical protein